ncbi:chemotaxis protein CheW [Reinekea marinisedimentorum]|uniref:Chemosensory pili system protein ChpC n=1 Tax=Reinekea marinisedimentorum TaxID=230495 RepID=A0A4R3IC65_9GAMM|nr:chemotaxis protein CheW [Reinekea marinisedimentorum]TCS43215.1 chemosensory pili system protein ChpC [Reinekea marinisedimentorum]
MKTPTRLSSKAESNNVSSLLVPVQNKSLLVPNVVLAEVIPYGQLQSMNDSPPWALGAIEWRGELLPVLSFEIANSQVHAQDSETARIAVFNTVSAQSRYKFYAVVVQGIPRMVRLTEAEVREDNQAVAGQAEKMPVITALGKAVIPDLDYLESLLSRLS